MKRTSLTCNYPNCFGIQDVPYQITSFVIVTNKQMPRDKFHTMRLIKSRTAILAYGNSTDLRFQRVQLPLYHKKHRCHFLFFFQVFCYRLNFLTQLISFDLNVHFIQYPVFFVFIETYILLNHFNAYSRESSGFVLIKPQQNFGVQFCCLAYFQLIG